MPFGIGAYSEAGPVSGKVPPIMIVFLVIPGTASADSDARVAPRAD